MNSSTLPPALHFFLPLSFFFLFFIWVSCTVYIYWVLAGIGVASAAFAALVFLGAMTFRATRARVGCVVAVLFSVVSALVVFLLRA
jgi:hypothetical protein